ncbi:hypothetical protein CSAL01_08960 [Colletotrichum salicis]|uniref:Heterokaryon incompatibility domain-containing protein n=1 Tax=Colletotrichum salicis TaxID=1209931 RepID=A0A135TPJ9_9PEZI|nr:hypothetical protein CSAL01_08960 [Colletotrichum salicis]
MRNFVNSLHRDREDCWELDVPAYEHPPIDRDTQEHRFLILHPCPGDKSDPQNHVRCSIEVRPLANAGPFIAVRDGRGYRLLQDAIEIDGKGPVVPASVEVFLRYFRGHRLPVTLWIRHICLREFSSGEEKKWYWTRDFLDSMDSKAIMQDKYRAWDKTWHYIGDESQPPRKFTLPTVYPIKLGKSPPSVAPVTNHDYVPLDTLVDEIRMLIVTPSEDRDAQVMTHLAHCPMVCEVVYHALAYTWGDPGDTVEIVVNGQKMQARRNLEQALRTIRSEKLSISIWIDAVCIDQLNVAERTRQVQRMFDIYDRASQVICDVGEHSDETDMALEFVYPMDRLKIEMNEKGEYDIGKGGRQDWSGHLPRALRGFVQVHVSSLLQTSLGRPRGCHLVGCRAFNPVLRTQTMSADPQLDQFGLLYDELIFVRKLFYFRHLMAGGRLYESLFPSPVRKDSPGFLEAAILTRDFQATDGRDKIFALWNLARDKKGLQFKMDYKKKPPAGLPRFRNGLV